MRIFPRPGTGRQLRVGTLVAVLTVLGMVVAVGRAGSASAAATTTIVDAQTGMCLDSSGAELASPVGQVVTDACDGRASQQWTIVAVGDPQVTIINAATGMCLDGNYNYPGMGEIYTNGCNGGTFQQWYAAPGPVGQMTFMDVQTGRVLDSNDQGAVYGNSANGGNYQNWMFTAFPALPALSLSAASALGATTTIVDAQTGMCLDSNAADPANTAVGQVFTDACDGRASQQWNIWVAGNPEVFIVNAATGMCLDGNYNYPRMGEIYTNGCNWGTYQQWYVNPTLGGETTFMGVQTGHVLDSNSQGAVYGNFANGGNYQNWMFTAFPALPTYAEPGFPTP